MGQRVLVEPVKIHGKEKKLPLFQVYFYFSLLWWFSVVVGEVELGLPAPLLKSQRLSKAKVPKCCVEKCGGCL